MTPYDNEKIISHVAEGKKSLKSNKIINIL
jgi:hypothetical protein